MAQKSKAKKLTGVVVPLGSLYTKENPVIGEYPDLIPFSKFCKTAGFSIIQLLPVNDTGTQSSPYSGLSAFALHPIYIRICNIAGFATTYRENEDFKAAYDELFENNNYTKRYDYDLILNKKINLLRMLFDSKVVQNDEYLAEELTDWIKANDWVKTYAVYKKLKWDYMQASWKSWKKADQSKTQEEILELWSKKEFRKEHLFYAWCQMIASEQLEEACKIAKSQDILIKGDMPILMNEDSCDAWAYPQFFNHELRAGSPSDGENPTGQNWGFPTYNWKNLKEDNYKWWKDRLKTASQYYDAYRLDHILGFFRIWAIPAADCNALNGHTEPFASFKRDDLYELGFDDDRIRWLSQPHIPTSVVEDVTWNREVAHKVLQLLCDRIGNEELWLFNKVIKGSQQIWDFDFGDLVDKPAADRIKAKLVEYWSNRTLLEVSKNKFIPLWTYGQSTSWASLNNTEKDNLTELFDSLNKKNEKLWKKQADDIFEAITTDLNMVPCGEDLGVGIECVPKTMKQHNILGLRVVRWSREWAEQDQPYIPFEDYEPLSVTTTSVHDSSTIRAWYEDELMKSKNPSALALVSATVGELVEPVEPPVELEFTPEIAYTIMKNCAESASIWYIPPLQDFLYMNKKYWLEKAEDERINVPGTVTKFNWTYRLPVSIEELCKDKVLISKIKEITRR